MRRIAPKFRQDVAAWGAGFLALSMLGVLSCSGGDESGNPHLVCEGSFDCLDLTTRPACGDEASVVCAPATTLNPSRECVYRVADLESCQCVQGDIRVCDLTSTTHGIKHCIKTNTDETSWGSCGTT